MPKNIAIILWQRKGARFTDKRYSRSHYWQFDGGVTVKASSSPHVVPLPMSEEAAVDPEEAFVASLSSCHMLAFLYIAAKRGFIIETYRDKAIGELAENDAGKLAMISVTLHPAITVEGKNKPSFAEIETMHHEAHEECFIANSVRTTVRFELDVQN